MASSQMRKSQTPYHWSYVWYNSIKEILLNHLYSVMFDHHGHQNSVPLGGLLLSWLEALGSECMPYSHRLNHKILQHCETQVLATGPTGMLLNTCIMRAFGGVFCVYYAIHDGPVTSICVSHCGSFPG